MHIQISNMSLDDVLNPIETAKGLPNAHYISPKIYAREKDILFFKNWSAIAFEGDVPKAGDSFPIDFMGMPLLLLRAKGGEVNVFQNTCRHRGMILVDKPTHLKGPIRCPYHSWCYDHGGALVRTPYVGGVNNDSHDALDPSELSLFKIRSHIWHGVVFVNISGDAENFDVAHADMLSRWAEFDQPFHIGGDASRNEITVKTNWKLAIENYCESYHLPWIHPELNEISPIDVHYDIYDSANFSGQGSRNYRQLRDENGRVFPDFKNISDKWDRTGEYISYFPNLLLGVHRDHALAMILLPQGPEETLERMAMFYAEDLDTPDWQDMLRENARIWTNIFNEDLDVVEGMQKGRHGPLFDGGKFSPVMDNPTHVFHKWVARHMQAAE
jgi:phenylpropionate dioxygenase-like ring-hydroxylating dioxygenase large terminal subunit